jgi:SAM-dependent methyltransferase
MATKVDRGERVEPAREVEALAEDARQRFEAIYERQAPWDVPGPQPALVARHAAGEIRGTVLDAGCGTGENALYLAAQGLDVWGVDVVSAAIGQARAKARARGLPAGRFLVHDALRLEELGMTFDTVIDSGLFHALDDRERALYVASLRRVLRPGGLYHVLCFSDAQPGDWGPRRISRTELRAAFRRGWRVRRIVAARFASRPQPDGARAWLATMERVGEPRAEPARASSGARRRTHRR